MGSATPGLGELTSPPAATAPLAPIDFGEAGSFWKRGARECLPARAPCATVAWNATTPRSWWGSKHTLRDGSAAGPWATSGNSLFPLARAQGIAAVAQITSLLDHFGYKVKRIGDNFRLHGSGDYTLKTLDGKVVHKMRHKLDAQHFGYNGIDHQNPKAEPGEAVALAPTNIPAHHHARANKRRWPCGSGPDHILPEGSHRRGFQVPRQTSPGPVHARSQRQNCCATPGPKRCQFEYPDHATRLKWEKRALTLSKQYLAGLEATYTNEDGMVNLEEAKQQIQLRISNGQGPQNMPPKTARLLLNKQLKLGFKPAGKPPRSMRKDRSAFANTVSHQLRTCTDDQFDKVYDLASEFGWVSREPGACSDGGTKVAAALAALVPRPS